jgi:AraC-like DNA-binding protein
MSPYVRSSHVIDADAHFEQEQRVIHDHALLYFERGEGSFAIADEVHPIVPRTLFLLGPEMRFGFGPSRVSTYATLNMHFDPVELESSRTLERSWDAPARPHRRQSSRYLLHGRADGFGTVFSFNADQANVYRNLFMRIHRVFWLPTVHRERELLLKAGTTELLAFLLEHAESLTLQEEAYAKEIEAALRHINERPHAKLTVDALAHQVGMGAGHFARRFRQSVGVPPMTYLRQVLVNRAKSELLSGRKAIKEIADELGYSTVHHFTRVFTSVAGTPPAQFRRANTGR